MAKTLIEALQSLDTTNDEHWTQDGLPRLDVLKQLTETTVTRADIFNISKTFNRFNAVIEEETETETGTELEGDGNGETEVETKGETESEQVAPTVVVKEGEPESFAEIEAEYLEAQRNLNEAKSRFAVAQEQMDEVIRHRQKAVESVPQHVMIRQFQQSQAAEREKDAGKVELLKHVAQGLDTEQTGLLKEGLNDIL